MADSDLGTLGIYALTLGIYALLFLRTSPARYVPETDEDNTDAQYPSLTGFTLLDAFRSCIR
jgi:hypothetical protein